MTFDYKYHDDCAWCVGKNMGGCGRGLFNSNLLQEWTVKIIKDEENELRQEWQRLVICCYTYCVDQSFVLWRCDGVCLLSNTRNPAREPLPCSADEGVSCPAVGEWISTAGASSRSSRQGDSRGKVRIMGCDSIGHCEKKKSSYEHVSSSEWLPR
jgi:hypothetical protein